MVRFPAVVLAILLLSGCAPRLAGTGEPRTQELTVGAARFRILYWPEDAAAARDVRHAIELAAPHVARWGGLRQPVTVTIHSSHEALERAVHRQGYDWLRAWARFQTIEVQSPRTWGFFGANERKLEELVTHELTHCAMYQLAGDDLTWMYKEIPRWFSEGVASVTAQQGYRYGGIEDLYEFYQERSHVVYGAAHHAVEFLIARYGEARVLEVMRLMGTGLRFPAAFKEAIGLSDAEFAADFRRYVVWQGWRR